MSISAKDLAVTSWAKDLGVVLDPQLMFADRVLKTTPSCVSSLAQISRVKHVLDRKQLVAVINALLLHNVVKHLEQKICRLQSVQNFAARIITGTVKFDHIIPALRDLRWLPLIQNLFFREAVMVFKCMFGQALRYLSDQFTTRIAVTRHLTRSCQLFKTSPDYRMVHIWNNIDNTPKAAKSISAFYLKNKLNADFLCRYILGFVV